MAAKKNSKGLYVTALVLFVIGVGYLMFSGIASNSQYFLNVSEALAMPADKLHSVRMFGTVRGEGITRHEDGPGVSFILQDLESAGKTIQVVFKGAVPDTFKEGAEVIVEGKLHGESGAFQAQTLMTKCPSKYQKENRV